jgi:hypothetical protein
MEARRDCLFSQIVYNLVYREKKKISNEVLYMADE